MVAPLSAGGDTGGLPPIGDVIRGTHAYALDTDLRPVPDGEVGELYIGGEGLARGYLGRPGLTAERFVPDPFHGHGRRMYRTGDLVRREIDGTFGYVGRNDDEAKTRGMRLNPAEVESALLNHPAVAAAAVSVRSDDVVGYLVRRVGTALHPQDVRAFLSRRLHSAAVPTTFVEIPAMPLLLSGKIDRRALPSPRPDNVLTDAYVPASGPAEEALADVFGELLGRDRVGRDDDFFALGGDSLRVTRLKALIEKRLGVETPAGLLFEERTPARIAAALFSDGPDPAPRTVSAPGPEHDTDRWLDALSDDEVADMLAVLDRTGEA